MQINKIEPSLNCCPKPKNVNFGAIPDAQTRKVLVALERNGVDTLPIMEKMRDNYADKFIMSNYNGSIIHMAVYSKQGHYATQVTEIAKFDPRKMLSNPKLFAKYLNIRLDKLAAKKSDTQKQVDKVENFFGRCWDDDSYVSSGYNS